MKESRLYILLLILIAGTTMLQAAETRDSTTVMTDSVRTHYKDGTRIYADTAIWQGMNIRLDLGTTAMEAIVSRGKILSFEIGLNCRLKNRFYPTLELGIAQAEASANGGRHKGFGGFGRVGLDINCLKKHATSRNAILAGIRIGTSLQDYDLGRVSQNDNYWQMASTREFPHQFRADVWGEIVGGIHVQIWEGLAMGWYIRLKILMTRKSDAENVMPYYIPGFGYRDQSNWGFNYYIGWKF